MSRYVGNGERCPTCGIKYGDFRTGFSYRDVYLMFWDTSPDATEWKYKRPGTILGKWHQIKKEMFARHIDYECPSVAQVVIPDDEVPF